MQVVPAHQLFTVSDPKRRYSSMTGALQTLYNARPRPHYLALTLLILCYIDAVAARGARGTKPKFLRFVRRNFPQLCAGLDNRESGLDGAEVLYRFYRSEMVHTFFSRNRKYAIAENHELNGAYVDDVKVSGTPRVKVAVNVDKLYWDFVKLAKRKARQKTL